MQKHVNLVDLVKSFPTNIFLQNLASIQTRTSPVKFAHLAEKSGKGSISNLSTKVLTGGAMSEMCPGSDRARTIECPGDCFTLFLCSSEVNLTSCQNTFCQNLEGESSESRVLENTTRRYPRMQPTGSGKTRAFQLQSSVHQPSNPRLMITMLGG